MGWIGVDLFFVLSGFLVSGLLFGEFNKYGTISPGRFLVRRGFKIYPIYYLFYIPYLVLFLLKGFEIEWGRMAADFTFTQNYFWGWGYAYPASWSLAVEEHFYFGLAFVLFLLIKYRLFTPETVRSVKVEISIASLLIVCLLLRLVSNSLSPLDIARNFSMTHLRIDSLLVGVLISYLFHFKRSVLDSFVIKHGYKILVLILALVSWTPFIDPTNSIFIRTFGFVFTYLAFGLVLIVFLVKADIKEVVQKFITRPVFSMISKVGYCSYSIYVIHTLVNYLFEGSGLNHALRFFSAIGLSVGLGMLMTYWVEAYFLRLRDRIVPSRVV